MTRFDATDETERRKLFVDAITAHRSRNSPYLTVEVEPEGGGADPPEDGSEPDGESPPTWLQVSGETVNADCTDAELDRLTSLLDDYPAFRIDEMESPEETEGTNVRITARADANRMAGFLDRAFRNVYDLPETYRAWVVEL